MREQRWNYCVTGNIVKTHYDADGTPRYGTPAYPGGAKVFLRGKNWSADWGKIPVVGLTRGKRYQVHDVPVELIENVRFGRVYRPGVLRIMDNCEFFSYWWHTGEEDRREAEAFAAWWNAVFAPRR